MSIDARVVGVIINKQDGSSRLVLEDRPAKDGQPAGIAGQSYLQFSNTPDWIGELVDKDIWGGSGSIMYGEQEIAKREGYTCIRFTALQLHGLGPAAERDSR